MSSTVSSIHQWYEISHLAPKSRFEMVLKLTHGIDLGRLSVSGQLGVC